MLQVPNVYVDPNWVNAHLNDEHLVLLDATIPVVGATDMSVKEAYIPGSLFFDIKKVFSDQNSALPNTVLASNEFEVKAQDLGINNNSCIVVYDAIGIYSSPRVWWLFKLMGFENIAVLNGGINAWKAFGGTVVDKPIAPTTKGDFTVNYQSELFADKASVFTNIDDEKELVIDARGAVRFNAEVPEPRAGLRAGHIPNAINLPYKTVLKNQQLKSVDELNELFRGASTASKVTFSCGSGITACILALAYEATGKKNYAIYDGSWTEWGSDVSLPIE